MPGLNKVDLHIFPPGTFTQNILENSIEDIRITWFWVIQIKRFGRRGKLFSI